MRERVTCRMCKSHKLEEKLRLSDTPIANSFPDKPNDGEFYPLILMQCGECDHVQLKHVLDKELLFSNYKYSTPTAYVPHLSRFAESLKASYPKAKRVLEIGSNNGRFLDELKIVGFEPIGVDPSIETITRHKGSYRRFFDKDLASIIAPVDLVVSTNTFAHIDDLDSVFDGIGNCLAYGGSVVFEVQHFNSMVNKGLFDMIYHEHLDYHNISPWHYFLDRHNMVLVSAEIIDTQGGSLRITVERKPEGYCTQVPGQLFIDWPEFKHKIEIAKNKAVYMARMNRDNRIVAFGAAAKACTAIHNFGIKDRIEYCVDDDRNKIGKYIAGTNIKIYSTSQMMEFKPDIVLMTAWNYEDNFKKRFPQIKTFNPYI